MQTDSNGRFLFSQVNPGTYTVTVRATGFAEQTSQPIAVEVGRTATLNFNLAVSAASQTVEVTAQQTLLTLENPNTTTTIESRTISNLPNAGSDLTFVAQFAPGALMNTAGSSNDAKAPGGYGNVEYNGLPATSNGYILDGYDTNDPWLGLNIGLSTNLVLGLDAVDQATVNTNSYSVDQGRYGASQVNYFTKSGTNKFHGDVYELWDGSLFSAEDYFLHANDTPGNITPKPRSNVNHFGFGVGGPIRKDKLFFFTAYEGVRIALPIVTQAVVPIARLPAVRAQPTCRSAAPDPITGTALPAEPAEVAFYTVDVRPLRQHGGNPVPVSSCPLDASGALLPGTQTSGNLFNGSGCANQREESLQNSDHENCVRRQNRPHHQRRQHRLVPLSIGHRPAGRLHRSHQRHLQLLLSAAAVHSCRRLHAHLPPQSRQPVQSRRKLVLQHLRAQQLRPGAADLSHRARRGQQSTLPLPPSAATTTPIPRAARSRNGRSTTTWTGSAASRSTASASTRAAST